MHSPLLGPQQFPAAPNNYMQRAISSLYPFAVAGLEFTISRGIITATCNFTQRMHRCALWLRLSRRRRLSKVENRKESSPASRARLFRRLQSAHSINRKRTYRLSVSHRLCRCVCMRSVTLHPISCLGALHCYDNKTATVSVIQSGVQEISLISAAFSI